MRSSSQDKNCVNDTDGLCFECVEWMHTTLDACADCGGARRCDNKTKHLLCGDGFVIGNDGLCNQTTELDALLFANNHAVKCSESHHADGEGCLECPTSCASCVDGSSCLVCNNGTSLSKDGGCVMLANATVQSHNGAVACNDSFFASCTECASCADHFSSVCQSCGACASDMCVRCDGDVVFENGAWRKSNYCADADGTVCRKCVASATQFNATDCVPVVDCSTYVNGMCVVCPEERVLLPNGSCVESSECTAHNGGGCLRCVAGMYADSTGVCKRLS